MTDDQKLAIEMDLNLFSVIGVKLKNRRVEGGLLSDGSIVWRFKFLQPDKSIRVTELRLSKEAIAAMSKIAMWHYESEVDNEPNS